MQINNLSEFNCLMRHGQKEETPEWYWTDGNDVDVTGVWTHAYDNSDVTYFTPTITCCNDHVCRHGGDALLVNVGGEKHVKGSYCDYDTSSLRRFICEAII